MIENLPKVAPGSLLHWLLRLTPGYAPPWLCSRDQCADLDLLVVLEACLIFGTLLLAKLSGLWWPAIVVAPSAILFAMVLHVPFQSRERWGRARRRRGECVWCGLLNVEPGGDCSGDDR
jgi:hypothetical protein